MRTTSNGSGFVVRVDGLIVTNAHVVANKATVSIRFFNGTQMEGTVVAVDPVSDLAAIKVHAVSPPSHCLQLLMGLVRSPALSC